jgi:hypothetical protein
MNMKALTQTKSIESRKIHSIHALPDGRGFAGNLEIGKARYQLAFTPKNAAIENRNLVLTGGLVLRSPNGQRRATDNVKATLLSTQGSISSAPPIPRSLAGSLKPDGGSPQATEATGDLSSVAVMYLKLSAIDVKALGAPADLNGLQINARLHPTSELERDLQWLYSALIRAALGEPPNEEYAAGYLAEINRILKA